MTDVYAAAGVDTAEADRATDALVAVLSSIRLGRPNKAIPLTGHYAAVLELGPNLGLALSTDGVGSKVLIAEEIQDFSMIGIDLIGMNANDVLCVGAEPIALLDYIAVERAHPAMLEQIAVGLKRGAELANIEIPGGEVAQLPGLISGHHPHSGFDLSGACIGTVPLDGLITGAGMEPGDSIIGIPSNGVHANGLTLARAAIKEAGLEMHESIPEVEEESVGKALLRPTFIYVKAILELVRSSVDVRGLAHITSNGLRNLLRLNEAVGYQIHDPLPVPPIFDFVQRVMNVDPVEMHRVFNMGCGFCVIVPTADCDAAVEILSRHHSGTQRIGTVTDSAGRVDHPALG